MPSRFRQGAATAKARTFIGRRQAREHKRERERERERERKKEKTAKEMKEFGKPAKEMAVSPSRCVRQSGYISRVNDSGISISVSVRWLSLPTLPG